jgi:PAS domain S-box-containing protein
VAATRPIDVRAALEKIAVPSAIADRDGRVSWANEAAVRMFGDLIGEPFATVVAPEHVPIMLRQLERKLHGAPATDYEVDVITKDGQRRRAEISSVRIPDGDRCHAVFGVLVPGAAQPTGAAAGLTPRQLQVLRLLAGGASTRDIADRLQLSTETVRNHVRHVLRALGVHSRLEAVAVAHERGLLQQLSG